MVQTLALNETLKNRSVLSLMEWSPAELQRVLYTARVMKKEPHSPAFRHALEGQHVALIFELPSTRTRVSFQVAVESLGAKAVVFEWNQSQLGRGEPIRDTARVLSRYVSGVVVRTREHETLQEWRKWADRPVFNALTNRMHPFQVLADVLTIWEKLGTVRGIKLAYFGDGNNMANSFLVLGAKLGMDVWIASPEGFQPAPDVVHWAHQEATLTGAGIHVTDDPQAAAQGADVVVTDVFQSMADDPELASTKKSLMAPYQVNTALMSLAKPTAIFLHCLPAHRGEEVSEAVLEGPQSVVFDEAENRLWVQKSVLYHVLADSSAVLGG
ncbi:ornithine carbamoyltransferase [Sulfobacillus harzensis]|uniref:Ornithine carbamoyltransferase n=1 Tax=Sulfobacillus harzensis TaxID=2729629 RepID=A0A7Y0L2B6_9FIRM|nr:ornithine carbamoyltransferase [Sulfobacillus harzensis]NMP21727.1 ornithine carbamoyltransferase [Sulfobacillus harzensis]